MTCREKFKSKYPDWPDPEELGACPDVSHIYTEPINCCVTNPNALSRMECTECWDREIPDTEKNEKEKKTMAKTKNELMEEINAKTREIAELKDEVQKLEKYRKYDDMAYELGAVRASFIKAGFTDDQAYDLIKTFAVGFMHTIL